MGQPWSLFHLFYSFQTHIITIFTTNKCENVHPVDSRPLEHESPLITNRPVANLIKPLRS